MHFGVHVEPDAKRDESAFAPSERPSREREFFAVIRGLVHELHPQRATFMDLSASSRLERDLGIDSLGRTEPILRIERAFGVRLPATVAGAAETAGDLLRALDQAHPETAVEAKAIAAAPLPLVPAATEAQTAVEARRSPP